MRINAYLRSVTDFVAGTTKTAPPLDVNLPAISGVDDAILSRAKPVPENRGPEIVYRQVRAPYFHLKRTFT
jgi:hypothetical protein